MTDEERPPLPAAQLVGVFSSPVRVEAQLVSVTPFGRLRAAGRRVVEDVDGPTEFLSLPVERQLAGLPKVPDERRAGEAWVETVANAIAKLTFGLRGGRLRVGLCLDAQLDGPGRAVLAAEGGARVADFVEALEAALRGRNIDLAAPIGRALGVGEAWARGEMNSALGGLAGISDGLMLVWDQGVTWARVGGGEVLQVSTEPQKSAHDLGLAALDRRRAQGSHDGPGARVFVAARKGSAPAQRLLEETAHALGLEAARRLIQWPGHEPNHPGPTPDPTRLVVGGQVGRLANDPRLEAFLGDPFESGLAQGLQDREDAAMRTGLLVEPEATSVETDLGAGLGPGPWTMAPGLVHFSQEDSSPMIGAASWVLRGLEQDRQS